MARQLTEEQQAHLDLLWRRAETGADFAEICRLEAEFLAEPVMNYAFWMECPDGR